MEGRIKLIAFVNSFLTYLLIFIIMSAIIGVGIFAGIKLRKRKNIKDTQSVEKTK